MDFAEGATLNWWECGIVMVKVIDDSKLWKGSNSEGSKLLSLSARDRSKIIVERRSRNRIEDNQDYSVENPIFMSRIDVYKYKLCL